MRFSLKWLLIAVALVAVSVVALLNANNDWRSMVENAALFAILVATAAAVYSAGERRAFCFGFALFGITYFLVLASPSFSDARERLFTSAGFRIIHKQLFHAKSDVVLFREPIDGDVINGTALMQPDGINARVMIVRPKLSDFIAVGNALFCIPFGLLGGVIARAFYRRRTTNGAPPQSPD
jgi:hypothetical protein